MRRFRCADEPSPTQPSATRGLAAHAERERGADGDRAGSRAGATAPRRCRCRATTSWVRRLESRPFVVPPTRPMYWQSTRQGSTPRYRCRPRLRCSGAATSLGRHRRGDADRGRLVALAGVERAGQLALLEEHVPALVEPRRQQQRVQDPQQRLPVEPERGSILQPTARLRGAHARNRHAASLERSQAEGCAHQHPSPRAPGHARAAGVRPQLLTPSEQPGSDPSCSRPPERRGRAPPPAAGGHDPLTPVTARVRLDTAGVRLAMDGVWRDTCRARPRSASPFELYAGWASG